ncbi:hypothetical protein PMAYCL1PPCAC_32811, partial [Pristionchus mayeri]
SMDMNEDAFGELIDFMSIEERGMDGLEESSSPEDVQNALNDNSSPFSFDFDVTMDYLRAQPEFPGRHNDGAEHEKHSLMEYQATFSSAGDSVSPVNTSTPDSTMNSSVESGDTPRDEQSDDKSDPKKTLLWDLLLAPPSPSKPKAVEVVGITADGQPMHLQQQQMMTRPAATAAAAAAYQMPPPTLRPMPKAVIDVVQDKALNGGNMPLSTDPRINQQLRQYMSIGNTDVQLSPAVLRQHTETMTPKKKERKKKEKKESPGYYVSPSDQARAQPSFRPIGSMEDIYSAAALQEQHRENQQFLQSQQQRMLPPSTRVPRRTPSWEENERILEQLRRDGTRIPPQKWAGQPVQPQMMSQQQQRFPMQHQPMMQHLPYQPPMSHWHQQRAHQQHQQTPIGHPQYPQSSYPMGQNSVNGYQPMPSPQYPSQYQPYASQQHPQMVSHMPSLGAAQTFNTGPAMMQQQHQGVPAASTPQLQQPSNNGLSAVSTTGNMQEASTVNGFPLAQQYPAHCQPLGQGIPFVPVDHAMQQPLQAKHNGVVSSTDNTPEASPAHHEQRLDCPSTTMAQESVQFNAHGDRATDHGPLSRAGLPNYGEFGHYPPVRAMSQDGQMARNGAVGSETARASYGCASLNGSPTESSALRKRAFSDEGAQPGPSCFFDAATAEETKRRRSSALDDYQPSSAARAFHAVGNRLASQGDDDEAVRRAEDEDLESPVFVGQLDRWRISASYS